MTTTISRARSASLERGPSTRQRILIVEDDVNLAENLAEIVDLEGYEAIVVHCAEDAFGEVDRGSIDAIVTDNRLSGLTGAALLSKLRSQGDHMPAVLVTAWADDDAAVIAENGDAYLMTKPVDIRALLALLNSLLERGR